MLVKIVVFEKQDLFQTNIPAESFSDSSTSPIQQPKNRWPFTNATMTAKL